MALDGNWLLSTVAQSTAALVAIIGGFLVSRVVALSAEKSSHLRQISEIEVQFEVVERDLESAIRIVYKKGYEWFLDQHLDDVIEHRGLDDFSDGIWRARGTSDMDAEAMWGELNLQTREALVKIESAFESGVERLENIADLRQSGMIIASEQEKVFLRVAEILSLARRPVKTFGDSFAGTTSASTPEIVYNRHDLQIAKREALESEAQTLLLRKRILEIEVEESENPEGLTSGFVVLFGFGIVGMVLPIILMSLHPVPDGLWVRALVMGGFTFGFFALFIYIFTTLRKLTKVVKLDGIEPVVAKG
jgi:hypothetical protein